MPEAIYDGHGKGNALSDGYALRRQSDPRIASMISSALGDARSVINVGAGTGSYEPTGRIIQAVEPSERMIAQRAVGQRRVRAARPKRCRLAMMPTMPPWRF